MDRGSRTPIKSLVDAYLTSLAEWRRARYQDDLRDRRNLQSADAIEEFRLFINTLPDEDARLSELERHWRRGESIEVGQQAAYEIGRFRFFTTETSLDAFLDQVIDLARADADELGHFGGRQVEGDEGISKLWES